MPVKSDQSARLREAALSKRVVSRSSLIKVQAESAARNSFLEQTCRRPYCRYVSLRIQIVSKWRRVMTISTCIVNSAKTFSLDFVQLFSASRLAPGNVFKSHYYFGTSFKFARVPLPSRVLNILSSCQSLESLVSVSRNLSFKKKRNLQQPSALSEWFIIRAPF